MTVSFAITLTMLGISAGARIAEILLTKSIACYKKLI